jgi:hypothetical protein
VLDGASWLLETSSTSTAISGMIEMLVFSIIPRAMRVETNSGQEKVEHFALSMLNHFKNRCETRASAQSGALR